MIPLAEISTVLLDLDGTLLDKYFDDYFWEHLLPEQYAEKNNITFGRAKEKLLAHYKAHEGTLNWTDIDFWSRQVDIDIPALKEQIRHLIEVHPHVEEFLSLLCRRRKRIYLVTNAHYKVLDIKLKKTLIGKYFDEAITSFELGFPKEMPEFWQRLERRILFDKERTLFVDDTETILHTAQQYGIRYLVFKQLASSKEQRKGSAHFPSISDFRELM